MTFPLHPLRRIASFAARPNLPRRTVRLRLSALYGLLFLASGAVLLTVTNVLVRRTTAVGAVARGIPGGTRMTPVGVGGEVGAGNFGTASGGRLIAVPGLTPQQAQAQAKQVQAQLVSQHNHELHQLLVYSEITLAVMAAVSILLGWIVAGRVLRPLRTITTAVQTISATNLGERLSLDGPDDELKELGETFNQLLARLEKSFEAQRRFVANASHELRTPLARQRTIAQVAMSDPEATVDSLRAAHERVLVSGVQQERLIEALLALARGEAGIERKELIDLSLVADTVLEHALTEIDRLGLRVETDIHPAGTVGDPRLVERLVANLVDNAARHNIPDGTIAIATNVQGDWALFSVTNTGPVIPDADLRRLFQPFQRMSEERTSHGDGVGLGLSIVTAIASVHDAEVAADARPAGGLCVRVGFPALPTTDVPAVDGAVAMRSSTAAAAVVR
jgi:signal transduction histidine kinase